MQVYASTTYLGPGRTRLADALLPLESMDLDGVELGSTHLWEADLAQTVHVGWHRKILTHNYFPPARENLVINIASTDADVRRQSIDHAQRCIRFSAAVGAEIYTIHPGFLADATEGSADTAGQLPDYDFNFAGTRAEYELAFNHMLEALQQLIDVSREAGVTLALETEGSITRPGFLLLERPDEFDRLFDALPRGVHLNVNLAHTSLAAKSHGFSVNDFVCQFRSRIVAAELSHHDGHSDLHLPLCADSPIMAYIPLLPDVPLVLEFRNTKAEEITASIKLLRAIDSP